MDARLLGVALGRGLVRPVSAVRQTDELGWRGSLVVHVIGLMMLAGVAVFAGLAVSGSGYRAGSEAWDSLAMRFGPVAWLAFVPMVLGSGVDDIAGQVGVPRGVDRAGVPRNLHSDDGGGGAAARGAAVGVGGEGG